MPLTGGDLTVEDGTGLVDANAYLSLADADSYHAGHGNDAWAAAPDNDRVKAVIGATQYIDLRWHFVDDVLNSDDPQALAWPRTSAQIGGEVLDSRGFNVAGSVPQQIADACAEYALIALGGPLLPVPAVLDDSGAFVTMKRDELKPLAEERRYAPGHPIQTLRKYPVPDMIIRRSGLIFAASQSAVR